MGLGLLNISLPTGVNLIPVQRLRQSYWCLSGLPIVYFFIRAVLGTRWDMISQSVKYGDWLLTVWLGIRSPVGTVIIVSLPLRTASGAQHDPIRVRNVILSTIKRSKRKFTHHSIQLSTEVKGAWNITLVPFIRLYCVVLHHIDSFTCVDCLCWESIMISADGYV